MPKENLQISEQSLTNSFLHKFRKSDTRIDQTHDHKDERHLLKRLRYQNPLFVITPYLIVLTLI